MAKLNRRRQGGALLDGQLRAQSKVPARFPVTHGHIEIRTSQVGLRRCRFVAHDGTERPLVPDPKSAEAFARAHPLAIGFISAASVLMLPIGVGLNVLQAAKLISEIPFIADVFGPFESPLHLPVWLNLALGLGAVVGAMERAMHMRHHGLLDGGAGHLTRPGHALRLSHGRMQQHQECNPYRSQAAWSPETPHRVT